MGFPQAFRALLAVRVPRSGLLAMLVEARRIDGEGVLLEVDRPQSQHAIEKPRESAAAESMIERDVGRRARPCVEVERTAQKIGDARRASRAQPEEGSDSQGFEHKVGASAATAFLIVLQNVLLRQAIDARSEAREDDARVDPAVEVAGRPTLLRTKRRSFHTTPSTHSFSFSLGPKPNVVRTAHRVDGGGPAVPPHPPLLAAPQRRGWTTHSAKPAPDGSVMQRGANAPS